MSRYLCHLRRINGRTQTELEPHDGEPPRVGTVVVVNVALQPDLPNETLPARIASLSLDPDDADGNPVVHVYMDEIG